MPEGAFPLGMVLDACPDIVDYAKGGISNWRDFVAAAAAVVRPMLGDQPERLGGGAGGDGRAFRRRSWSRRSCSAGAAINSAGGYLRGLTRKAEAHEFSLGPMLMALIGSPET